jgi:hypothetical protein
MRRINYTKYWSYGNRGQKSRGSLAELILDIPDLMPWGIIPPLHVLNECLLTGGDNGGMSPGTTWKPFSITQEEYDELVTFLVHINTDVARIHHPYLYAKTIRRDEEFEHSTNYLSWIKETSEKYRPLADWMQT